MICPVFAPKIYPKSAITFRTACASYCFLQVSFHYQKPLSLEISTPELGLIAEQWEGEVSAAPGVEQGKQEHAS